MTRASCLALLLLLPIRATAAVWRTMAPPPGITVKRDVADVAGGHPEQVRDPYRGDSGPPRPPILRVHGGAWTSGDPSDGIALHPLRWGFAPASVDYRLTGDATFPAQIEDCEAAVRWFGLTPRSIASAGRTGTAW
jgi:acetyl esterase/lipase